MPAFFSDLIIALVLLYGLLIFNRVYSPAIVVAAAKEKYKGLYDLYKLNQQLGERNLSFDSLDQFGTRFFSKEKDRTLKEIDEEYEKEKETSPKNK